MAKKKRQKQKTRTSRALRSPGLQARPIRTNRKGIWRRIPPIGKIAIGGAVSLLGVWAAYVQTIKPRVQIQAPQQLVDPKNPYDAPFTLVNDGYLTVHHVSIDCVPALVAVNGLRPASKQFPWDIKAFGYDRVLTVDALPPDEPKPFVCDVFKGLSPTNVAIVGVEAQVTVTVSPFSFVKLPYPKSVLFEADSNGTQEFQWHELAVGERPHFPKADMWMVRFSHGDLEGFVRKPN
jgi:hypothetical protein